MPKMAIEIGLVVHYITETPHGLYVLPARVIAIECAEDGEVDLRIYTDMSGGSEWMASARYSDAKEPGTWHYRDSKEEKPK